MYFGLTLFVLFFFLWLTSQIKKMREQSEKEEIIREIVRRTIQKRKIDELYGRDE